MRQVTCAEGQQGAVQYYIDLMVRHKGTVKGFLLMRLQIGKEDDILTIVMAAYGCPARIVFLDVCKRSASTLMRQVTCAEGQQCAVRYYIDLMVRHKGTVKEVSLI